jgi:hypothetical protein
MDCIHYSKVPKVWMEREGKGSNLYWMAPVAKLGWMLVMLKDIKNKN